MNSKEDGRRLTIYVKECKHEALDHQEIRKLARRLASVMRELDRLGLGLFGGSDSLQIRGDREIVLADISGDVTGGCGAFHIRVDGYHRGEGWNEGVNHEEGYIE